MSDLDDDEVKATRELNGVDKTAVNKDLELIKTLIKEYKIDIKGVSYRKQFRLLRTIENLIDRVKELEEEKKIILNSKIGIDLSYDDYIPKQKVKDLIKNETINISGFECIAIEDLEELLEDK